MAAVSESARRIEQEQERPYHEVAKGFTSFRNGDVIVAKITPCFENGKMALVDLEHEFGFGSTEFHVIRPDQSELDGRYLFYFLGQEELRSEGKSRMTGSAGQRRVPKAFFEQVQIPLPSLPEQRRIAAVLDAADALRAKRRAALAKLDALLQSVFLEMFGDPVRNERGWEVGSIDLVVEEPRDVRCGPFGTQLKVDELVNSGVPLFGIENVHNDRFVPKTTKYLTPEKAIELRAFDVRNDDVLVTRMGTIGRACVVSGMEGEGRFSYHLFRVRPDKRKCLPEFLAATIAKSGTFQRQLERLSHGAIMAGLSTSNLRDVKFLLPAIEYQESYLKRVRLIERERQCMMVGVEQQDHLFYSLQQRAFQGDLT